MRRSCCRRDQGKKDTEEEEAFGKQIGMHNIKDIPSAIKFTLFCKYGARILNSMERYSKVSSESRVNVLNYRERVGRFKYRLTKRM